MKKKGLIISSYPAPYRVGVFQGLAKEFDVETYFDTCQNENRNAAWFCKADDFKFEILDNSEAKVKFRTALKNIKSYDFVIAYDPARKPAIKAILVCIANGVPYFVNNDGAFIKPHLIKDTIKRILFSKVTACFSSGKSATQYFHYYGVPYNKIVAHKFPSLPPEDIAEPPLSFVERNEKRRELGISEKKTVISVGQFIPRKGFDILLQAWSQVSNTAQLIIIGGGDEKIKYEKMISELGINNVLIMDFMPKSELFKYYQASDLFVLPTREDVWGLVINEAMAIGMPVISTNRCNAALELIENNINGFIVKVGDSTELAAKINAVLNNSELNVRMSNANIKKIRQYTLEEVSKSHIDTINKELSRKYR